MRVHITDHAYYDRWIPYCGSMKRSKVAALVERHLYAALRSGAELKANAVQLEIFQSLNAVVTPELDGSWNVVTFYRTKKEVVV